MLSQSQSLPMTEAVGELPQRDGLGVQLRDSDVRIRRNFPQATPKSTAVDSSTFKPVVEDSSQQPMIQIRLGLRSADGIESAGEVIDALIFLSSIYFCTIV